MWRKGFERVRLHVKRCRIMVFRSKLSITAWMHSMLCSFACDAVAAYLFLQATKAEHVKIQNEYRESNIDNEKRVTG
jgi:hypothetical protein